MKPEKTFRIGSVSASVFLNEVETDNGKRQSRSVSIQRSYRDDKGEWKASSSLRLAELPQAITVLEWALRHVASQEADVTA